MKKLRNVVEADRVSSLLKKGLFNGRKLPDRIEQLEIPFYLFQVFVNPGDGNSKSEYVLIDAFGGAFSFFELKNFENVKDIEPEHNFHLSLEKAREIANREYLFHLLHRNLRTKLQSTISKIEYVDAIFYPFWVGYFVHSNHYSLEVIDGLNGKKQSGAIKKVVADHLTREFESSTIVKRKLQDIAHSSGK